MIIYSKNKTVLYDGGLSGIKASLQSCAAQGISLYGSQLRKIRLRRAALDGLSIPAACLWGADLRGCDMADADLRAVDLRQAQIEDCCFANSDFTGADLRGASFNRPIWDGACLDGINISCPSFWQGDFSNVGSFKSVVYTHKGEEEILLHRPPVTVSGLSKRLVLLNAEYVLAGNDLLPVDGFYARLQNTLNDVAGSKSPLPGRKIAKNETDYPKDRPRVSSF